MGILNSELDRIRKELSDLPESISDAAHDVLVERLRQIRVEGWTPEHDDEHTYHEMAFAAACYAEHYASRAWLLEGGELARGLNVDPNDYEADEAPDMWPNSWDLDWWKPSDPRRDLVRAAALLIAEIERLDRKESGTS